MERLFIYDDFSVDGTRAYLASFTYPMDPILKFSRFGGPIAAMNDYLSSLNREQETVFAKIDSDTMVPPGWLDEAMRVMYLNPGLGLLGIEAFNKIEMKYGNRGFERARHIGGIGLMRSTAFITLPRPKGRFGFTEWQIYTPEVTKGWIKPAIPVFLLDRLPREPWCSYSNNYVCQGWQRRWPQYPEDSKEMWSWWCE